MQYQPKETVAQRTARIAKEQQDIETKRLLDEQVERDRIRKTKVKYQEDNKDIILVDIQTKIDKLTEDMQDMQSDINFIKEYLLSTIGDNIDNYRSCYCGCQKEQEHTLRGELQIIRELLTKQTES